MIGRVNCSLLNEEIIFFGGAPGQKIKNKKLALCDKINWVLHPSFGFAVKPKLTVTIDTNVNSTVLNLVDDVSSWEPGDRIVVASTDYSMYQAEEFQVLPCPSCRPTQVKVAGKVIHLVTLVLHFTNSILFTEWTLLRIRKNGKTSEFDAWLWWCFWKHMVVLKII